MKQEIEGTYNVKGYPLKIEKQKIVEQQQAKID